MRTSGVRFSIASHAAWAPGVTTQEAWIAWARTPFNIGGNDLGKGGAKDGGGNGGSSDTDEPLVRAMPAMLRRRAGFLGKMALEVAYRCLDGRVDVPTVFCSRHGEAARAIQLLDDLAQQLPVSPTGFAMAVHNASAGLLSIARSDSANHVALAAGASTVEHAVIEACGLLADGAPMVLLVAYDCGLPPAFAHFEDCAEQPHAWAWLMVPAAADPIRLEWSAAEVASGATPSAEAAVLAASAVSAASAVPAAVLVPDPDPDPMPAGLQVLRFQLSDQRELERVSGMQRWRWLRGV